MARRLMTTAGSLLPRVSDGDIPPNDKLLTTQLTPSLGTQCIRGFIPSDSENIVCKFNSERGILNDYLRISWSIPKTENRTDLLFGFRIIDDRVSLRAYEFRLSDNIIVYREENPIIRGRRVLFTNPLPIGWIEERDALNLYLEFQILGNYDAREVRRTFKFDFDVGFVSKELREKMSSFRGDVRFPFPSISVMETQNEVDRIPDITYQRLVNILAPQKDDDPNPTIEEIRKRLVRALNSSRPTLPPVNTHREYCQYFYHFGPFRNPKAGQPIKDEKGVDTDQLEPEELPGQWRVSYPKKDEIPDVTDEEIEAAFKIAASAELANNLPPPPPPVQPESESVKQVEEILDADGDRIKKEIPES